MADNRYGGRGRHEGWRGRDDSIFSDDDDRWSRGSGRWSSDYGREREPGDERGFFERAGDEVRSWFGDEEAERRRERDVRRDEGRGNFDRSLGGRGVASGSGTTYGLGSGDLPRGGSESRAQRDRFTGQRGFGSGRSQWDDHYRQWRDRQIEQFDREYEDYCRERQQRFEQDFDSWRGSRLTEGGTGGQFGGASSSEAPATTGGGGRTRSQGAASGTGGALGTETAGAASGTGSSMESSTGSPAGGRGGRARN
jgi:hypothetical protein